MRYENQTFVGAQIDLDKDEFTGCTFRNCAFSTSGKQLHLQNFRIQGTFSMTFQGEAAIALNLLKILMANPETRAFAINALTPP